MSNNSAHSRTLPWIIAVVVQHAGDRGVGHLVRADHVLDADLNGVAAERAGDLIDCPFDRETGAWTAHASVGTGSALLLVATVQVRARKCGIV